MNVSEWLFSKKVLLYRLETENRIAKFSSNKGEPDNAP